MAPAPDGPVVGDDGLARCPWGDRPADYRRYHDEEWGRTVTGEHALFERLSLEAFQSGLSWLTILRRREGFRRAFAGFDPEVVAAFGDDDVERLLLDPGIIRNRAKVVATVRNARAVVALRADGGLEAVLEAHRPPPRGRPERLSDLPAATPESTSLARTLKRAGLTFVGPTTAYAAMQACGYVDDHLAGCHVPPR
ncbi:DNA-3-methyladenine glycosylase I [Aquipuribacter nitratireducens]|uniref:DNA-3-methyladenine glycosylase I n=1 Tax=Aquipuribacter nitratireducens TaxID=650104 RepID=A0ABW0GLD7_9MICO